MQLEPTSPCEECGWRNWIYRRRCRNCGHDLVQHPEREIDAEVRLDYADGVRAESAALEASGEA